MAVRITRAEYRRLMGGDSPPRTKASIIPLAVDGPPGRYEVYIPGWHPASVNELLHSVRARVRLKKRDRKCVGDYLGLKHQVPAAKGLRRVDLRLIMAPGQRCKDVDAHHKSLLDSLKSHGFIINDSPRWVAISPVVYERGEEIGTWITLEDIPGQESR